MQRKGIILAGGSGSRLAPLTAAVSKQLMPVYDKPMIYYPLSSLMLSGIREVLIITTPRDQKSFQRLLGDGSLWGMTISYEIQKEPDGLAQAFIIGSSFIGESHSALLLGDNLFHGSSLIETLKTANSVQKGASIFSYPVSNPESYGVVVLDKKGLPIKLEEKPKITSSRYAITGIYFYDNTVVERARKIIKSERGEFEITDLNQMYLDDGQLNVAMLGRGMAWLDTGTHNSLIEAGLFIKTLEQRQGLKVGCPEEIAWRSGWINDNQLEDLARPLRKSGYGNYLIQLLEESSADNRLLQRNL